MGKRVSSSVLGIPIWILTGLSLFVLFSAVYDFIVLDKSAIRYGLMIASVLILIILVIIHFTTMKFVSLQARRQMGG